MLVGTGSSCSCLFSSIFIKSSSFHLPSLDNNVYGHPKNLRIVDSCICLIFTTPWPGLALWVFHTVCGLLPEVCVLYLDYSHCALLSIFQIDGAHKMFVLWLRDPQFPPTEGREQRR